jgi:hypothetical protein
MDRHEEGFLLLTLFPRCVMSLCFLFMSIGSFSNVTPPEERQWRDELFAVVSKQRLIPKNQPLYIHVHGYREKWRYKLPLGFPNLKPLRVLYW